MFTTRSFAVATLAAVATFALSGQSARAQSGVYGAVVKNNLPFDITFQYSFNNGPWVTKTLRKGASMEFSVTNAWLRANPGKPVNVILRWDSRINDGQTTFASRRLNMWGCGSPSNGWAHGFILVNDMKTVSLQG